MPAKGAENDEGRPVDYVRESREKALGARLRRISEQIDRDATRLYASIGFRFEQRWFGPINQLLLNGPMIIGDIANRLGITHASVSQAVSSLEAHGWVRSKADPEDGRRRVLTLTAAGRARAKTLAPLWSALDEASIELDRESESVVAALERLEQALERASLEQRVTAMLQKKVAK